MNESTADAPDCVSVRRTRSSIRPPAAAVSSYRAWIAVRLLTIAPTGTPGD